MTKVSRLADCRRDLDDALDDFDRAEGAREVLAAARTVRASIDALEQAAVQQARAEGVSWSKIGAVYGLTKQGAQQRFRERAAEPAPPPTDDPEQE